MAGQRIQDDQEVFGHTTHRAKMNIINHEIHILCHDGFTGRISVDKAQGE